MKPLFEDTEFYSKEGTHPKSEMLQKLHPKESKVIWRWNRWHHWVDYSHFQEPHRCKLVLKQGMIISNSVNNYGMKLKTIN